MANCGDQPVPYRMMSFVRGMIYGKLTAKFHYTCRLLFVQLLLSMQVLNYFQDYSVNFYLRQSWRDPRLAFNANMLNPPQNKIKIEDKVKQIWVPDVFVRNEKKAEFHDITIPNVMLTLNTSGYVWYVTK